MSLKYGASFAIVVVPESDTMQQFRFGQFQHVKHLRVLPFPLTELFSVRNASQGQGGHSSGNDILAQIVQHLEKAVDLLLLFPIAPLYETEHWCDASDTRTIVRGDTRRGIGRATARSSEHTAVWAC